jgi:hypothetical protein
MWAPGTTASEINSKIPNWKLNDSEVEDIIDRIWKAYYNAIAQLNDILQAIDDQQNVFQNNNYELIKGEALGLRAFLHLDLLRLFGPIPDGATNKPAIPYVDEMTKDPNRLVTMPYTTVIANIIRDLDAAEALLKEVDPLLTSDNHHLNNPSLNYADGWKAPSDLWQTSRQTRFNYYAVLGAKARYYHWIGDKTNAVLYAKKVIDSKKFRLAAAVDYGSAVDADYSKNLVMLSEHLFGVNNPSHQDIIQSYFKQSGASLSGNITNITTYVYEGNTTEMRNIPNRYWIARVHTTNSQSGTTATTNHFLKYGGNDEFPSINRIPVLRLCELYFILLEDAPLSESASYYSQYVDSRTLPIAYKDELTTDASIRTRLEKEYRKEFYGEGQIWYFYKQHKYTTIPRATASGSFAIPADYINFEIPKPKSQVVFE